MSAPTYQSRRYAPELVIARYIGFVGGMLMLYEVDAQGFTIKSGPTSDKAHPADLVAKARELQAQAFNQVRLPPQGARR